MRRVLFFTVGLLLNTALFGQNEHIIEHFTAGELNGKVLLTWTIHQGYTCNGIKIERSLDTINYTEIGSVNGICGSYSKPTEYAFTDQQPLVNFTNYYRLLLGGVGYSKTISIEVYDVTENTYLIYPLPITSSSALYFENPSADKIRFRTVSLLGVESQEFITYAEKIELDPADYSSGIYLFTLINEEASTILRGKFVVP